jgi:ribosomal protein S18 acetylase RimI-like enzyme
MDEWTITIGFAERHRTAIVALLREYEAAIGVSLHFQAFEAELDRLPGAYQPPGGQFIVARSHSGADLVGCVAVRPVGGRADVCEMKRLYVRNGVRGTGLGRSLAMAAMVQARRLGYARMCLDTLPTMTAAQALYRALGFRPAGTAGGTTTGTDPQVLLFERALELD